MSPSRRLSAIVFTDLEGFTLHAHEDEREALRLVREQEMLLAPILSAHGGRKIKSMGDGLLLEFPNARDAVECAVALQQSVHERNSREGSVPLRVRIGIHLGDVEENSGDILGDAVNIASRIESLAVHGGVCLSAQVYDQVLNKVPYQLETLGPKNLKGIREPVRVYRVVLPWESEPSSIRGTTLPRVAVLPLTNISPDPKDEYFAEGLTEELTSALSQIRGLRVISRTTACQYRGTSKSVAQIGSELGVESILEGSVRKAGDQLRISVQLIDTRSDEHRWAKTYDRRLENVFAIQAEVAEQTASALKVELLKSEREALHDRPTSNLAAYEAFLRGIQAYRASFGAGREIEATREGERYFEDAIRRDPTFSAAYSYLADLLIAEANWTRAASEAFPRARALVAKSLELAPNSSDAHTAAGNLALQADLDWVRAEAEFQQAIALNPNGSAAHHWYGMLLTTLQRFVEAERQTLAAIELDPLSLPPRISLVVAYQYAGDYESAIRECEASIERFGDSPYVRVALGESYALAGREDDAIRTIESMPEPLWAISRATRLAILTLAGKPEEARAFLSRWEKGGVTGVFPLSDVALVTAAMGDKDRTFALLERAIREGDRELYITYQNRVFDPVRGDERFVALLRSLNLPATIKRLARGNTRP